MLELPEYAMLRSRLAHLAQHLGYAVVGLVAGTLRVAGNVGAAEQEQAGTWCRARLPWAVRSRL